jgi:hypothetical protein
MARKDVSLVVQGTLLKNCQYLSKKDSQFAVELIYECAVGLKCFAKFYLDLLVDGFIASFEEHVMKLTDNCDQKDELLAKVLNWNKMFYPPKMVEEAVMNRITVLGVTYLTKEKAESLIRMNELISKIVTGPSRLLNVMKQLVYFIENKN